MYGGVPDVPGLLESVEPLLKLPDPSGGVGVLWVDKSLGLAHIHLGVYHTVKVRMK